MNPRNPLETSSFEHKALLLLLVAVSLAFAWILRPFFGAIFWAVVLAILFTPMYRRMLPSSKHRPTLAALATLVVILLIVVLPVTLITALLIQEVASFFQRIQSGELNFSQYLQQIVRSLPDWLSQLLNRFGIGNLDALQQKIATNLAQSSQAIAARVFNIGQNTFDLLVNFFIVLYLVFFLLRDGAALSRRILDAVPLRPEHKRDLLGKFATVIRATVKGNILVAVAQGALGGIAFAVLGVHGAVLWAVMMAFLSLLPAIGAALIWLPVALYFLVTGFVWQGVALIAYGVIVIGLVDNLLRPILVGKDTKMPDYLVLMSTLGGMALFGLNGFVIGPVVAAMFIAVWDIFAPANPPVQR
ncbi:AI-2E family transporter [Caldimonas tepidiphila]|uniref:AI-2E family transporter n=1 Tax=Caldimonas tepidiphila TaxID=2315841 RepID=UPI000E5A466E|nr:AI-2E family transporter [Caldimonas tepidiphila]